jgi:hypothetical protein
VILLVVLPVTLKPVGVFGVVTPPPLLKVVPETDEDRELVPALLYAATL